MVRPRIRLPVDLARHQTMVSIRPASPDDAHGIREIYAPYVESTPVSFELVPPTADYFREKITEQTPKYPWLVAEVDNQIVGYAYAAQYKTREAYRWGVESSIYLAAHQHRKGIGRALYDELFSILRRQHFRMVYAGITLPNAASQGLHEAFGFQQIASFPNAGYKNGNWHDVGWWALDLGIESATGSNPLEPIPYQEL